MLKHSLHQLENTIEKLKLYNSTYWVENILMSYVGEVVSQEFYMYPFTEKFTIIFL